MLGQQLPGQVMNPAGKFYLKSDWTANENWDKT